MADRKTALIAGQNDLFRKSLNPLMGRICITAGVVNLGQQVVGEVLLKVLRFDQFTADNDPYGEHDFGVITHREYRLFWKIDYYSDDRMVFGSRDPSDPVQTYRLLTLMLASEY